MTWWPNNIEMEVKINAHGFQQTMQRIYQFYLERVVKTSGYSLENRPYKN